MRREDVLFTTSLCFVRPEEDEWRAVTEPAAWEDFRTSIAAMAGVPLDGTSAMTAGLASECVGDYEQPLRAIVVPPTYESELAFANRHFVGGLPQSALPVESLYAPPEQRTHTDLLGEGSFYLQQPADYMQDLVVGMGMTVPPEFHAAPDHLALELDMASVLLRSGLVDQASDFIANRFLWLPRYRARLASIPADTTFHTALLDLLWAVALNAGAVHGDAA